MKIKSVIAAMAAAFGVVTASADTYVFDVALSGQDNVDWTVKESYSGTYSRNPAADDTVEIPAGVTAKVSAGSASWTLINTLMRIVPKDGAVFEVDVPATYEGRALLAVPVSEFGLENATDSGILRKAGGGVLELTSYGKVMDGSIVKDYFVDVEVNGGDLHLYAGGAAKEKFYFQEVSVAEGATLHICYVGYSYFTGLNGEGFVTLDNAAEQQRIWLRGDGTSSYSGLMTGKIRIDVIAGRHDILCPTNKINTICLGETGVCGITRIGPNNDTAESSLGSGNFNFGASSGIIYLGDEAETSSKTFWIATDSFIDAGAYGGLTLAGKFDSSGDSVLRTLTLCGNNANVCTISGTFPGRADQKNVFYLRKTGTGTWYLKSNSNRGSLGVIDVENGILQFNLIAEKGYPCSFGYATNLFEKAVNVAYNKGKPVNYAFVLGGDGTVGTLEYVGSKVAECSTRPLAVRSTGRLMSTGAALSLADIYALGTGSKTLTLDGSASGVSAITAVSNGVTGATLSVVKEGPGNWELHGTNTFTGSVFARGGTMRVCNLGTQYRWYRICITENIYGSSRYTYNLSEDKATNNEKAKVQMLEVALYDSAGANLLAGFTTGEPDNVVQRGFDGDFRAMAPGTAGFASTSSWAPSSDGQYSNLFDSANSKIQGYLSNGTGGILLDTPSTWFPMVVRLPDNAGEAVRIDFLGSLARSHDYNGRCPTAYRLDGSVDGLHWDVGIAQDDALEPPEAAARWYSDPNTAVTYGSRPGKGFAITRTTHAKDDSYAFTTVGAANGALLEVLGEPLTISGLEIDASASAGVISNIVFAAEGTVNVVNADVSGGAALELPGDYSELDGFANLSGWHVSLDGDGCASKSICIKDGRLMLYPMGFRFILR